MYKINNIAFANYGIQPSLIQGEGIAMKGIFDLPKRIGDTHFSWQEENSVEPYVDADEIFLDARELEFAGIVLGSKFTVQNSIAQFKTLVDGFTDLVLLETPYGDFSVQIKKITAKQVDFVTTITIVFSEPEIGLVVPVLVTPTTYASAAYSETAIKNNCATGNSGTEVTLTALAAKFTSIISQAAADQLAVNWVRENKQDYANINGSCTVDPTIYYNTRQTGILGKNDCGAGFTGSLVNYVVEPFIYSSLVSQADADSKALNEINTNLTQQYANDNGTCSLLNLFYQTGNTIATFTTTVGTSSLRLQTFFVQSSIPIGTIFFVSIYGIVKQYTSVVTANARTYVIDALVSNINNTTNAAWNALNQAPVFGGNTVKPVASVTTPPIPNLFPQFFTPQLEILMNSSNQATIWFEAP
jgi:hypothetical protein